MDRQESDTQELMKKRFLTYTAAANCQRLTAQMKKQTRTHTKSGSQLKSPGANSAHRSAHVEKQHLRAPVV